MLKFALAATIALSAPLAAASVAEAATTKVIVVQKDHHPHRGKHRVAQRCVNKKVTKWVHGRKVVRTTRVCR